jgi:hypothetical protein
VTSFTVPKWGHVNISETLSRTDKFGGAQVIYWEGTYGGHNDLGWTEAGIDLIARISGM